MAAVWSAPVQRAATARVVSPRASSSAGAAREQVDRPLARPVGVVGAGLHEGDARPLQQHLRDEDVVVTGVGQRGGEHLVEHRDRSAGELGDRQPDPHGLGRRGARGEDVGEPAADEVEVVARRRGLDGGDEPLHPFGRELEGRPVGREQVELGGQVARGGRGVAGRGAELAGEVGAGPRVGEREVAQPLGRRRGGPRQHPVQVGPRAGGHAGRHHVAQGRRREPQPRPAAGRAGPPSPHAARRRRHRPGRPARAHAPSAGGAGRRAAGSRGRRRAGPARARAAPARRSPATASGLPAPPDARRPCRPGPGRTRGGRRTRRARGGRRRGSVRARRAARSCRPGRAAGRRRGAAR